MNFDILQSPEFRELYWKVRFKQYPTLQGAGHIGKSLLENQKQYEDGFKNILSLIDIDIKDISILDVGCGIGWQAAKFKELGAKDYTCIDITDVLFWRIKQELGYECIKLDITENKLSQKYDLILMIDVTQHLVSHSNFSAAMRNVKDMMGGILIITSWLSDQYEQVSYYESKRPLSFYQREFEGYKISKLKYRDKWVLKIGKT